MDLVEKLAALAARRAADGSCDPITLRKKKLVLGVIPWVSFDCAIRVGDKGDCWVVMLSPEYPSLQDPFFAATFRKRDGARDSTFKKFWPGSWLPVFEDAEEREIFERSEDAVNKAYAAVHPPFAVQPPLYDRFTDRARKVMQLANQEAQRFNHEYIGTEHVLLGLIKEGSGVAANVLKNLDVDLRKVRLEVEKLVLREPDIVTMGQLPGTTQTKKVTEYSMEEAHNLHHNYVGTEHILLGLLREQEGVAARVLANLGLTLERAREEVLNLLGRAPESVKDIMQVEQPGPPSKENPQAPLPDRTARKWLGWLLIGIALAASLLFIWL